MIQNGRDSLLFPDVLTVRIRIGRDSLDFPDVFESAGYDYFKMSADDASKRNLTQTN